MSAPGATDRDYGRRRLPIAGFLIAAVLWLLIIQLVGLAVDDRADVVDGRILTVSDLVWTFVVPLGAGCAFVYGLIAYLGWWRPLLHDPKPVRRWVWVVPAIFAVAIVLGIDYGGLADRGLAFTLVLLVVATFVGFGEEGMFRCIGVTSLRRSGLSEAKVALWSSVIFGLAHVSNVVGGDARALAQAVVVSFAGYFFYLIRRVSRSNILNSVLHGLFDFTIISGTQIIPASTQAYPGALLAVLVYVICGIVLLVRRNRIEPATTEPTAAR
jgi:CAAX protease family protein